MTARALSLWRRQWLDRTTGHHYGVFRILFVGGFFLAPFLLPLQATRVDVQRALSAGTEPYTHPVLLLRLLQLPTPADAWLRSGGRPDADRTGHRARVPVWPGHRSVVAEGLTERTPE